MNITTHPARTFLAAGAIAALALGACGSDEEPAAEISMQPSSITAEAQESDGDTVTIASVDLPSAGFIAVHGDGGGSPGPVIGVSGLIGAGTHTDISITLDSPITENTTIYPMVHIDTDANGVYEFGTVEGVDTPGLTADGGVAVVPAEVTVAGAAEDAASSGDSTEGAAAADGDSATIAIAGFAFSGVTEVPVGTTVVVTNEDGSPHTWTERNGVFQSGTLEQGDTFEFTFTEAGTFEYFCAIHPSMTGTITVTG